jgi:hypothetical protein
MANHSSLLRKSVIYGQKSFIKSVPGREGCQVPATLRFTLNQSQTNPEPAILVNQLCQTFFLRH